MVLGKASPESNTHNCQSLFTNTHIQILAASPTDAGMCPRTYDFTCHSQKARSPGLGLDNYRALPQKSLKSAFQLNTKMGMKRGGKKSGNAYLGFQRLLAVKIKLKGLFSMAQWRLLGRSILYGKKETGKIWSAGALFTV